MIEFVLPWLIPGIVAVVVVLILASGYVKAPPDQAYIISGLKKESKAGNSGKQ